nr:MAG TPA: hypothetical protein [Caudoviricetes sp.]
MRAFSRPFKPENNTKPTKPPKWAVFCACIKLISFKNNTV